MKKTIILLLAIFSLFTVVLVVKILPVEKVNAPTQSNDFENLETDGTVPLPTPESIVRRFFELINEGRVDSALTLFSPELLGDESYQDSWRQQFNSIKSINVVDIEPFHTDLSEETDAPKIFKVTLEAYVTEDAKSAPIPYYGWHDNPNTRFIYIQKDPSDMWRIADITTGP